MPTTAEVAGFAADVTYDGLPEAVREAAKRRVLDAVGVGIGSIGRAPTDAVRRVVTAGNATGRSRLWGSGSSGSPSDAALYNAALAGCGNDATFLSPALSGAGGTTAAVLAAAEARSATGEAVVAGLAAAHEVQGELAWNAPLDGFHPATHAGIAAAVGAARASGLDAAAIESAVGLAATRATLAVEGENAESLAAGRAARTGVDACLLAEAGVEAPDAPGGPGGWRDLVGPFDLDLDPGCERVRDAAVLPYGVHPHAQTAVEAAVGLAEDAALDPADVDSVTAETVADAVPRLSSTAVAAALVDRAVATPPTERADLRPVVDATDVRGDEGLTGRADRGELPARVVVRTRDGGVHEAELERFTGHPARPAAWGTVEEKFHALTGSRYDAERRTEIVDTVRGLEAETVAELSRLLD